MNTTLDLMRKRIQHNERKQGREIIAISNIRIQNYLGERGIEPLRETERNCYYLRTPKLLSLLESYQIENYIMKN